MLHDIALYKFNIHIHIHKTGSKALTACLTAFVTAEWKYTHFGHWSQFSF